MPINQFRAAPGEQILDKRTGQTITVPQYDTTNDALGFYNTQDFSRTAGGATEEPINRTVRDETRPFTAPSLVRRETEALFQRPEAPSQKQIREQELARAQEMIEATKGVYLADLARLQRQGAARAGQTTALAVGAGLAGTPFQQAQEFKTEELTGEIIGARQAERAAEISRILGDADAKAEQRYQARRGEFESERDAFLGQLKERQAAARETVTTLARGGYSLDDLSEAEYRDLLDTSGLSDFEARAIHASESPTDEVSYEVQGGRIITIRKDAQGNVTTSSEPIAGLEEAPDGTYTTKISGNNIVLIPDNVTSPDDIVIKPIGVEDTRLEDAKLREQELKIIKLQNDIFKTDSPAERAKKEEELKKLQLENRERAEELGVDYTPTQIGATETGDEDFNW